MPRSMAHITPRDVHLATMIGGAILGAPSVALGGFLLL